MNILILTGSFGMGHNSCALAIKQELNKECNDSNCFIVDINKYIFPFLNPFIYKSFNVIVNKCHHTYNLLYKISQKQTKMPFKKIFMKQIYNLLREYKPDIIISTLPMSSKLISKYKEVMNCELPLITCITDISIHKAWVNKNTDIYFVATQISKDKLAKYGVKENKIHIVGIPVKEDFISINKETKKQSSKKILIMGGGLGLIHFNKNFYRDLNNLKDIKTVIILGKNQKIFKKLNGKYDNIEIIGYCDNVHKYMQDADIIISKAGGITLFESIYVELPLFVICPFLEQEIANANYIENECIGKVIWNKKNNLINEISIFISNEEYLYKIKDKMKKIKIKSNETKIASIIEKFDIPKVS